MNKNNYNHSFSEKLITQAVDLKKEYICICIDVKIISQKISHFLVFLMKFRMASFAVFVASITLCICSERTENLLYVYGENVVIKATI